MNTLAWSDESYSLRTFMQLHKNSLPQVIYITEGYDGRNDMHQLAGADVYWIEGIAAQTRVLLKDGSDRSISIPYSYPSCFRIRLHDGVLTDIMDLQQAVTLCKHPEDRILMSKDAPVQLFDGADYGQEDHLGRMEILDVYDQKYLIAHTMIDDFVLQGSVVIPLYLPIKLSVATGLRGKSEAESNNYFAKVSNSVIQFQKEKVEFDQDIQVLNTSLEDEYDYLEPFLVHKAISQPRRDIIVPGATTKFPTPPPLKTKSLQSNMKTQKKTVPTKSHDRIPANATDNMKPYCPPRPPKAAILSPTKDRQDSDSDNYEEVCTSKLEDNASRDRDTDSTDDEYEEIEEAKLQQRSNDRPSKVDKSHRGVNSLRKRVGKMFNIRRGKSGSNAKDESKAKGSSPHNRSKSDMSICSSVSRLPHPSNTSKADITAAKKHAKWTYASDIPTNITEFTVGQVESCLECLGLGQYIYRFRSLSIDGELLTTLDTEILTNEFGFSRFEANKLINFTLNDWRPKY